MDISEILKEYEQYEKGRNRWLIGCMQSVNEAALATIEMITMQEMQSEILTQVTYDRYSDTQEPCVQIRAWLLHVEKYKNAIIRRFEDQGEEHETRLNLYRWYKEISK